MRFLALLLILGPLKAFSDDFSYDLMPPKSPWQRYVSVGMAGYPNTIGAFDSQLTFGLRKLDKLGADFGVSAGSTALNFQTFLHASLLHLLDENPKSKYYGSVGGRAGTTKLTNLVTYDLQGLFSLGRVNSLPNGFEQFFELNLVWPSAIFLPYPVPVVGPEGHEQFVDHFYYFRRASLGFSYGWCF